jgi:hypothetical protein
MRTLSKTRAFLSFLLVGATCLLILQGCGGGSSDSEATAAGNTSTTAKQPIPGAGSKYAKFGEEASEAERETVSAILEENFKARAAAEFGKQCKTLSAHAIKATEEEVAFLGKPEGCVNALQTAAKPLKNSEKLRANNLSGPIDALRTKGNRAYALFIAKDGKPNEIALRKEGGEWKVDTLVSTEIPAKEKAGKSTKKGAKSE